MRGEAGGAWDGRSSPRDPPRGPPRPSDRADRASLVTHGVGLCVQVGHVYTHAYTRVRGRLY